MAFRSPCPFSCGWGMSRSQGCPRASTAIVSRKKKKSFQLQRKQIVSEPTVIPPTRWLFSTLAPIILAVVALKRKSVNKSGAVLGIFFAFVSSIASHMFLACLITFFFSSSRATKFRAHIKKKIEKDFKEGKLELYSLRLLYRQPPFQVKVSGTGFKFSATVGWLHN